MKKDCFVVYTIIGEILMSYLEKMLVYMLAVFLMDIIGFKLATFN